VAARSSLEQAYRYTVTELRLQRSSVCCRLAAIATEEATLVATTVTRIPDEVLHGAKAIASLQGKTTNEVLAEAWQEYLESHRDEIAANVERAAGLLRSGDMDGLIAHANRDAEQRARRAAEAVQL
jgi:hypothetical protein